MYVPESFRETRLDVLHDLMNDHPFATLITLEDGQPSINHLPLLLRSHQGEHGTLVGHLARANEVWLTDLERHPATAIFHGPAAYVSPSWYPAKSTHHRVVPTWNYATVHAEGRVRVIEEAGWLGDLVRELTDRFEATSASPWRVADAPEDFVATMLRQIIGIELSITRLTGKWKLSQNRPAADVAGVIAGLRSRDRGADITLADLMARQDP